MWAVGAVWVFSGQNFGRYILPTQLAWLFFASLGAVWGVRSMAHAIAAGREEGIAWLSGLALAIAYFVAIPTIEQVATLGPW